MTRRERFVAWFADVNAGAEPYPWQCELVEGLCATGRWPTGIRAPTGSGKSAVIEAHVFAVAESVSNPGAARPPRRLVLVAPRRVLVDDQHERALRVADMLAAATSGPVAAVATALGSLLTSQEPEDLESPPSPLLVTSLRGGIGLDTAWRLDPSQCQIICATPQMFGSRLLLRGFRASRRSRNLEAGLLSHDAAVVIDEAHLHERLTGTAERVAGMTSTALGLQVIPMSATRASDGGLTISDTDLQDAHLQRRVAARKRIELRSVSEAERLAALVAAAREQHAAHGGTVGVFVNTVGRAIDVAAALDEVATVEVVCGRMRPVDLDRLRDRRPGLLDARGNTDVDFLITTQSLEVGVDLDLPAMVSELAPAHALAQRFGRLNRSGSKEDSSCIVIGPEGEPSNWQPGPLAPYDAIELGYAIGWLDALGGDGSPGRVSAVALPRGIARPMPAIRATDIATLAMTSLDLSADVDPGFYVDEPADRRDRTVTVVARDRLVGAAALSDDVLEQLLPRIAPLPYESAPVPVGPATREIVKRAAAAWVLSPDATVARRLTDGEETSLHPGDTLFVPSRAPIMTRGVVGAGSRGKGEPIDDVMAIGDGTRPPVVLITAAPERFDAAIAEDRTLGSRKSRDLIVAALSDGGVDFGGAEPAGIRARLRGRLADSSLELFVPSGDGAAALLLQDLTRAGNVPGVSVTDGHPVSIDDHQQAVRDRLASILDRVRAPELDAVATDLLRAAQLHDEGKRHPRFQRRMGRTPELPELAKPAPGHLADRGDAWRHEQLSAAYAVADGATPLTMVVLAAHHGAGRPLFDRDASALLSEFDEVPEAVARAADALFGTDGTFERARSDIDRTFGTHRLSYLEALLRTADVQVSREGG